MMRAVIYARYSTDLQREASIDDQVRVCRQRIKREGWKLGATYSDAARSGASRLRPGYQKLLEDARAGAFEVVVAEALDRLSRDQEDVAALYKRLSFAGIKMVTLAEGEISELHVGLKGTMNALFLKDLAQKIRRGLEGRVRSGKSGGGLPYGYRVARHFDDRGELLRGDRVVEESEAETIRRIYRAFAAGKSPRAIARELNLEGLRGSGGRAWADTTIRGNAGRGCGILRNEVYIGQLIWNRQRFLKDPVTGRRVTRINPKTEWVATDVPEWRIVPQELWERVQVRFDEIETRPATRKARATRFWEHRRPKHILTGLVRCAACGGTYSPSGRHYLSCSNARRKGTCNERKGIPRTVLEDLILDGLKGRLMAPELVKEFIRAYHAELNQQRCRAEIGAADKHRELEAVSRKLAGLIDAVADGLRAPDLQERLDELTSRKQKLQTEIAREQAPLPRIHPNLAEVYRKKVECLQEALQADATRYEAIEILQQLIEKVTVSWRGHAWDIELVGEIANMVALSTDHSGSVIEGFRRSVKVVAGERYQRYYSLFSARIPGLPRRR
jgi:DNA invertase Pin-like site-specific DNA recombinase